MASIKVMTDLGHTPTSIAKSLGRSHHTIIAYLQRGCDDPEVHKMVELIRQSELRELHTIGFKSRTILNDYLDRILRGEKEANPISVTAILDRTFTQRRLIEGTSTQNIDYHATIQEVKDLERRLKELEEEEKDLLK